MFLIGKFFPEKLKSVLFGNRNLYGTQVNEEDKDWKYWQKEYHNFYNATQKKGVGQFINNQGYKILNNINFQDKKVLEIGPGSLYHLKYFSGIPEKFLLADIDYKFLNTSMKKLENLNINTELHLIKDRNNLEIDIDEQSIDCILTFYSLEHLYKLEQNILEYKKFLKPGGLIIGTVPCEGGLAWGLGRFITSRRWMKKNTTIDPDKIICWEHPQYISSIKSVLDNNFQKVKNKFFPFYIMNGDINLLFSFIYKKIDS